MTPSPTKEAIERLEGAAEAAWARGSTICIINRADLATLLASHDKLVEWVKEDLGNCTNEECERCVHTRALLKEIEQ